MAAQPPAPVLDVEDTAPVTAPPSEPPTFIEAEQQQVVASAVREDGSVDVSQALITGGVQFGPVSVPTNDGRILPGLLMRFPIPPTEENPEPGFYKETLIVLEDQDMMRVGQKFKKACDAAMAAARQHRVADKRARQQEAARALAAELAEATAAPAEERESA